MITLVKGKLELGSIVKWFRYFDDVYIPNDIYIYIYIYWFCI